MEIKESFEIYFSLVEDTRKTSNVVYNLSDILFLLMCGILCGCTDIEMVLEFAEEREAFFKKYTNIETIPCVKTVLNVLKSI